MENEIPSGLDEKIHLLIVEDYKHLAETFGMVFKMAGFLVTVESDPLSALKLAEANEYKVFLIDLGLDNFSGIELARRIRKMPQFKRAFLIAMTGLGAEYRCACINAGFDEFFTKPVDVAEIVEILRGKFQLKFRSEAGGNFNCD